MNNQIIFIDDSGDPGLKKGSSHYFVIACVVFENESESALAAAIMNAYKARLGWSNKTEFKFNKTQKKHILGVFRQLENARFKVVASLIKKSALDQKIKPNALYNETIRDTLLLCEPRSAKVRLDGHSGHNYMKHAIAYFRQSVNIDERKIIDFRFVDSSKNVLIQLADLVAGSVLRSTKLNKSDNKLFLEALKDKEIQIKLIE